MRVQTRWQTRTMNKIRVIEGHNFTPVVNTTDIRGYQSAAQFRALGCNTWNANANKNQAWLDNPHRKGEDDMGLCYGVIGRAFPGIEDDEPLDQYQKSCLVVTTGTVPADKSYSKVVPIMAKVFCPVRTLDSHTPSSKIRLRSEDIYQQTACTGDNFCVIFNFVWVV
jgi:hypothetical protein